MQFRITYGLTECFTHTFPPVPCETPEAAQAWLHYHLKDICDYSGLQFEPWHRTGNTWTKRSRHGHFMEVTQL